jgi:AraC-like DNA-binding protein
MIYGQKLPVALSGLVSYLSPLGGSMKPASIGHKQLWFELINEGSVYDFGQEPTLRGEGSVFCHQAGQVTVSESPHDSYYRCVVIRFECRDADVRKLWPRHFQWQNRQAMHAFLDEMLHAFHYAALNKDVIGALIWSRLCLELERFKSSMHTQGVHPQIYAATNYINVHYSRQIGIDEIAMAAGVSGSHLYALFREHLRKSPHQYLIQKRMRAAGHALVSTTLPIKAIANDVGYMNTENFCRAFKSFFGQTAAAYRQAYS